MDASVNNQAEGFSGFAITKKATPKAATQSSLASASKLSAPKTSIHAEDKHESLRRTTEAAQVGLKKDDIESMAKALEEDPTAFDYDDIYEEMQPQLQTKKKPATGNARYGYGITVGDGKAKAAGASTGQSRYIEALLSKARDRESERELVKERQIHRENMKYEEQFGSTESFVTPEYQAKLAADRQKREELEAKDRRDASTSSMASFYTNLARATVGGSTLAPEADQEEDLRPAQAPSQPRSDPRKADSTTQHDRPAVQASNLEFVEESTTEPSSASKPRQSLIAENTRKPRRHTDEMIESAKARYHQRQQRRQELDAH